MVISIDRTKPFNPAEFIAAGWNIEESEQDQRSQALTEIDLTKVTFVDCLKDGELEIKGEEKLSRLKQSGQIRLDAGILQTLWENQHLIPESLKEPVKKHTRFIFIDGTILRSPHGRRCVLYLCWNYGKWWWSYFGLDNDFRANNLSAVLTA